MKITISETAKSSLKEIVDFLKANWTVKEIQVLETDIRKFRQIIAEDIIKHPSLERFQNIGLSVKNKLS